MVHVQNALLRRAQVAEVLGVSVQTVGRLIRRGELQTVKVGERFVRIPRESLDGYLRAQAKGGTA